VASGCNSQTACLALCQTTASACTQYGYDNPFTTPNLTQIQQWDNGPAHGYISSSWTYSTNGNVLTHTDPNGNTSGIQYDGNQYPMTVIAAQGTTAQRTTQYSFYAVGLEHYETDDNNITTTYSTYDNIGRATQVTQTGAGVPSRTVSTSYDDVGLVVTTTQSDSPQSLVQTTYSDALGRVRYVIDGAGNQVQKAYRYGAPGSFVSYELESNPYISINDPNTMGWTVTTRDAIGRVKMVQHYGGSALPTLWGGSNSNITGTASTAYNQTVSGCANAGTTTQVTDEAPNTRSYCSDGLGRMTAVIEPTGTITTYTNDLLNNLIGVSVAGQPNNTCTASGVGQTRCFAYSSLSRLTSATNAEGGATAYGYDNSGNTVSGQTPIRR
jgi:YD repeat-containing protein